MDLERFRTTDFERRTARVSVPALSTFFGEGPAELVVQSLTGSEVFRAEGRVQQNAAREEAIKLLSSTKAKDIGQGILKMFGLTDDVPGALVKAIAYVEFGTVLDGFEQSDSVRLADFLPDTFLSLFNKIHELTGLGHVPVGELNATGITPESGTP